MFSKKSTSSFSSILNKSIWLADLFSWMFFDFNIMFGIDFNNECLLFTKLSNAPACTRPSSCNLLISFGFTRLIKSDKFLKFPFFNLSLTTLDIAS